MDPGPVDQVLQRAVEAGDVFGVVAAAADRRGPVYQAAFGRRRVDEPGPMAVDALFRVASMTKAVTSVAAMQLVEQGRLDLDTPVQRIVPDWAALEVLDGFDGDTPRLRPPAIQATVRQLLTHTAGLSYWIWNAGTDRYERLTGQPNVVSGERGAFRNPLVRDPGARWEYGMATDWLGRVVEAVAGEPLDVYFEANIFGPLGMGETTVRMTSEQRARSVPVHARTPDGYVVTDFDWNQDPDFWAGGHCLYSTAGDFLAFQRALLGKGRLDSARILDEATVEQMFSNQIGHLRVTTLPEVRGDLSRGVEALEGQEWGFGFLLNPEPWPGMRSAGTGGWAGLFNTYFWVDHAAGLTALILMQYLPFFDVHAVTLSACYEQALYAGLVR